MEKSKVIIVPIDTPSKKASREKDVSTFNGKIGTLKLSLEDEVIKPNEKNIIERMLSNTLSFVLSNERNNKGLYQTVINNFESLKGSNALLKQEVIEKSDSYAKSISYRQRTIDQCYTD